MVEGDRPLDPWQKTNWVLNHPVSWGVLVGLTLLMWWLVIYHSLSPVGVVLASVVGIGSWLRWRRTPQRLVSRRRGQIRHPRAVRASVAGGAAPDGVLLRVGTSGLLHLIGAGAPNGVTAATLRARIPKRGRHYLWLPSQPTAQASLVTCTALVELNDATQSKLELRVKAKSLETEARAVGDGVTRAVLPRLGPAPEMTGQM